MFICEPAFEYEDSVLRPFINGTVMYLKRKNFHTFKVGRLVLVWSKHIKHNTKHFFETWNTDIYHMLIAGKYGIGYGFTPLARGEVNDRRTNHVHI